MNALDALSAYELSHLVAHLADAGRRDELHRLLALEAGERNAWYELKDRAGDAGYLDDVRRGWSLAEAEAAAEDSETRARAIGLMCRYALLAASIGSRVAQLPPELLPLLVERGTWTAAQALSHAAHVPSDGGRSAALAALAPALPPELARAAADAAWRIGNEHWRFRALAAVAPRLDDSDRTEIVRAARAAESEDTRTETLVTLGPQLSPSERAAVLEELQRDLPGLRWGARRVSELAPELVALGYRPEEALALVLSVPREADRDAALRRLAPTLPTELVQRVAGEIGDSDPVWAVELGNSKALAAALDAVRARKDASHGRALGLVDLALGAPPPEQPAIMAEALEAIRAAGGTTDPRPMLARLIPVLPDRLLGQALDVARGIYYETSRAPVLAQLAGRLPEAEASAVRREALATARAVEGNTTTVRAQALLDVALLLPEPERMPVLREALAPATHRPPPQAFVELARAGHVEDALALAERVGDEEDASATLAALAPHLDGAERTAVLERAVALLPEQSGNEFLRSETLVALAPQLPKELLGRALSLARALGQNDVHGALVAVTGRLAEVGDHEEALAAARSIRHAETRFRALAAVAPHMPPGRRTRVLALALATARSFALPANLPRIFPPLAAQLPDTLLPAATAIARGNPVDWAKAELLAELASHVPEPERQALAEEALEAVSAVAVEEFRQLVLARVARTLAEIGQAPLAHAAVLAQPWWGEEGADRRTEALVAVAPYLREPERDAALGEALQAVRAVSSPETRAHLLRELARGLGPAERTSILAEALAVEPEQEPARARMLAELVPELPRALLAEASAAIRTVASQPERSRLVSMLLVGRGVEAADGAAEVREALRLLNGEARAEALRGLAALAPAIVSVAGPGAAAEASAAVCDVVRWFP